MGMVSRLMHRHRHFFVSMEVRDVSDMKNYLALSICLCIFIQLTSIAEDYKIRDIEFIDILKEPSHVVLQNLPRTAKGYRARDLEFIDDILKESSHIVLQHVPNSAIGSGLREKDNILKYWKYKMILKCSRNCYGRETLLKSFFADAIKQTNECPIPFNTVIKFLNNKDTILNVFVSQSGHCLLVEEKSFFIINKFSPLVDFFNF